jgi:calcineurin-like phosphoesterase family protein
LQGWVDRYLSSSPCKKWIVRGNHDGKPNTWWLNKGFGFAGDYLEMQYMGERIGFSHKPINDASITTFHGHWHNTDHRAIEMDWERYGKNVLLAIENSNYKPWILKNLVHQVWSK